MTQLVIILSLLIPSFAFGQDISSPDYFAPSYGGYQAPSMPSMEAAPRPPAIDLTPTYLYQNDDPARSITIMPTPSLKPTYLYPGANPGDPVTVVRPNGTIYYLYPGRVR